MYKAGCACPLLSASDGKHNADMPCIMHLGMELLRLFFTSDHPQKHLILFLCQLVLIFKKFLIGVYGYQNAYQCRKHFKV